MPYYMRHLMRPLPCGRVRSPSDAARLHTAYEAFVSRPTGAPSSAEPQRECAHAWQPQPFSRVHCALKVQSG